VTLKLAVSRSRPPVPYGANLLFLVFFIFFVSGPCARLCISQEPIQLIAKRDIEMFNDEPWKPVYFGVKVTSHKNSYGVGLCTLVSTGLFQLLQTRTVNAGTVAHSS